MNIRSKIQKAEGRLKMNFEEELNHLKEISEKMGSGSLSLEESLKLYSEATELAKKLKEYIVSAKLIVEQEEAQ